MRGGTGGGKSRTIGSGGRKPGRIGQGLWKGGCISLVSFYRNAYASAVRNV